MSRPDLNLLVTLDVLLAEGSVAGAAKRLHLSSSAMSRALARLRQATGDPLLVRAGRGLVPTPRALELKVRVAGLVEQSEAALRPVEALDLRKLNRTFTLRTSDGFVENFGPALVSKVADAAPGVRLRFLQKADKESEPLRDGAVDLETGVVEASTGPEMRAQLLFRDRYVGVVRRGHALCKGAMSAKRYASGRHVSVLRRGVESPIDGALAVHGLERNIAVIVGGFAAAIGLVRDTDLITAVPERHTGNLRTGLFSFGLPIAIDPFAVSLLWHPRSDADLGHQWMRGCIREVCTAGRKGHSG